MCHFITAVLPPTVHLGELTAIAHKHHRKLDPLKNPSIEACLKPGERYFLTTKGMCDCGTTLGCGARRKQPKPPDLRPRIRKLRAKGWSETKISRWLEDKRRIWKIHAEIESTFDEHWNDDWFFLLAEILDSGFVKYVGLLLHWYSGPLSGRIRLSGRKPIELRERGVRCLAQIEEDILYEFH